MALAGLLAGAPAFAQSAAITASNPAALNQGNLRGATVSVTLTGTTYATSTAAASHFTLATAVPGLAVYSVGFNNAGTVATLRLHYDGSDFDAAGTIAVTVADAATGHNAALTTGTQAVAPARWVNVSKKSIALTEGGGNGTYAVTLESPPTGNVTVTVTSDNAAVSRSPATLTFTTTTWNTAQTVTVSPVDDNADAVDELALVTNEATGGGYATSTVASRTVRVTVDDDEQTGTDYDTDDDQLIEISSHAQLNAMRWDLDGNGASANSGHSGTSTSAFAGAAAGMGCPDGGDSNQTPDGCLGYELTANIDLDTDGDGSADSDDAYWNSGRGWDPIGDAVKYSTTPYTATFRGNGHVISNLHINNVSSFNYGLALFAGLRGARIESLGIAGASVTVQAEAVATLAGRALGGSTVVGVYAQGSVGWSTDGGIGFGGLIGVCEQRCRIVASYTAVDVRGYSSAGGIVGRGDGVSSTVSYAHGRVRATSAGVKVPRGLMYSPLGATVRDSYWDRQTTGQTQSSGSLNSDGLTTAELQAPTGYTGIYWQWDDYDLDGDGRVDADDAAWHFGQANQYPVLKWAGHSPAAQFQAQLIGQTDTAPTYGSTTVSNKEYDVGERIRPFQIPAPTGGNGTYDYTVAGLPTGLVFDEDGTGDCLAARTVCGAPSAPGEFTVTVTVQDADVNMASSDQISLMFTVMVGSRTVVVAPNRLSLTEGGSGTYTVVLAFPPSSTVTVAVSSDNPAVTLATSSLTFTTQNWNTAQSVTATAASDADAVDELATIANAASNGGYDGVSASVQAMVRDDETRTGTDYDFDNDGLIEVDSLAKLNAIRWDLDGDGTASSGNETNYAAAFGSPSAGMGCPDGGDADQLPDACAGYELTADLDFDTDGDGATHADGVGDAGDDYDNGGLGWEPIGMATDPFAAWFDGNGRLVRNLFANRASDHTGLFGAAGAGARFLAVGLPNARVAGGRGVGALVGAVVSGGRVVGGWSTGSVSGANAVGGLVGEVGMATVIMASYSTAAVECADIFSNAGAGGLAGGRLNNRVGVVEASWSAGAVTGACPRKDGLIGGGGATTTASYWDATASGIPDDANEVSPEGLSTAALRSPTGYTGIYQTWNIDLDGDYAADDPWDFGTSSQYPSLKWRGFDPTEQFVGALAFASAVSAKRFVVDQPIAVFEVPAVAGGAGAVRYAARGLPAGLWFDGDGRGRCGLPRSVCGTPTETGSHTVSVTARDADGASAVLTFAVVVTDGEADAGPPAVLADEALRMAVARALNKVPGAVTEADLRALSSLNAAWSGVSSLEGLAKAANLRRLELGGNAVSDLSELSELRLLEHLDLSGNAVEDLSALSGLTRLETLLLSDNRVSDLRPLRDLTALRELRLDGNAVEDLTSLVRLASLVELSLSGNPVGNLSPLCALTELRRLWLSGAGLSDISELSCLTALVRLDLSDNAVEDVSPLRGMRRLSWLDLERNAVSNVSPLRRLGSLERLRLGSNRVESAVPLAENGGLGSGDVVGLRGNPLSRESILQRVPELRERGVAVLAGLSSPWFAAAGDAAGRSSFVRLVNRSDIAGEALLWGVDDAGERFGPARLAIGAGRTAHVNSEDLERGNAAKGLPEGLGPPTSGGWRLEILSTLDLEAQTFLRPLSGPPAAAHDTLPREGGTLRAAFLPAGRERSPGGELRVSNPTGSDAVVYVWGVDDDGRGRLATGLVVPAGGVATLSSTELERWRMGSGRGLGRGVGNWRLELTAPWPLEAQALATSAGGGAGNLSTPGVALTPGAVARVPLFPPASADGRVGVARVSNLGAASGVLRVAAVDDAGVRAGPVSVELAAFETVEFDSRELEEGGRTLEEGVGSPTRGSWRLELRAEFGGAAYAYATSAGGGAASLLDAAPRSGGSAHVPVLNPGSNRALRGLLRLVNDSAEDVSVTIEGVDDAGRAGGTVRVSVPAGEAVWLSAAELESGGAGFTGSLGGGEGKWRLTVSSDTPLTVMSLVEDERGALGNLSTPGRR